MTKRVAEADIIEGILAEADAVQMPVAISDRANEEAEVESSPAVLTQSTDSEGGHEAVGASISVKDDVEEGEIDEDGEDLIEEFTTLQGRSAA